MLSPLFRLFRRGQYRHTLLLIRLFPIPKSGIKSILALLCPRSFVYLSLLLRVECASNLRHIRLLYYDRISKSRKHSDYRSCIVQRTLFLVLIILPPLQFQLKWPYTLRFSVLMRTHTRYYSMAFAFPSISVYEHTGEPRYLFHITHNYDFAFRLPIAHYYFRGTCRP